MNQSDFWDIVDMRAHKPFMLSCACKEAEMKMEIQIYDNSAALTRADELFIQAFFGSSIRVELRCGDGFLE